MTAPKRTHGIKRALAVTGAVLGTTLTFTGAAVGGALLHIGTPPMRRVLATQVNNALANSFEGKVTIERIDRFGLGGFEGIFASVYDPAGRRVLHLQGMRAHIGLPTLAWAMLAGKGDIHIDITEARIDAVEAYLVPNADGAPTIVDAFKPKNPTPSQPNARGTVVSLPRVAIGDGWVHGKVASFDDLNARLHDVDGTFETSGKGTKLDLEPFAIDARGVVPRQIQGRLEGHLRVPADGDLSARASFAGRAGDLYATAVAAIDGKKIDADVYVPEFEGVSLREIVPAAPIYDRASAHAEVHGTLPLLHPVAQVKIGAGEVDVKADVNLGDAATTIDVVADAKRISPRSFAPSAPVSSVTASVRSAVTIKKDGTLAGTFALSSSPAEMSGQAVPGVDATGSFTQESVKGHAIVHEEGAPTELTFDLHPRGGGGAGASGKVVDFDGKVAVSELSNVRRIRRVAARGRVIARARGRVDIDAQSLDARVYAALGSVKQGDMSLGNGNANVRVFGPLKDLVVDATVTGNKFKIGGREFANVSVTSTGPVDRPYVTATLDGGAGMPRISARAQLASGGAFEVRGAMFEMWKGDVHMVARVDHVRSVGNKLDLDGVTVDGLGSQLTASVHMDGKKMHVIAKSDDIDLTRAARLFGTASGLHQGHASLDVDLMDDGKAAHGHVIAEVTGGSFMRVKSAHGKVALAFEGRGVEGSVDAFVDTTGTAKVKLSGANLGGSPFEPLSWRNGTGTVDLDTAIALDKLADALPMGAMPLSEMAGKLLVTAHLVRPHAHENPDVDMHVRTEGLKLTGAEPKPPEDQDQPDDMTAVGAPKTPWHVEGLDLLLDARVAGQSGMSDVVARIVDAHGMFVSLSAQSELPIVKILKGAKDPRALLEAAPVQAHLAVYERSLDKLPLVMRPPDLKGNVSLGADVVGTLEAPRLAMHAIARGLTPTTTSVRKPTPIDVDAVATYDAKLGGVHVLATRHNHTIMDAKAKVDAPFASIVRDGANAPWNADANVVFDKFPLHVITPVADRDVHGHLNGTVDLRGLHKDAHLDTNLVLTELRVGDVKFAKGTIGVKAEEGKVAAVVAIENPDGNLRATVDGGMDWGSAVAPALRTQTKVEATLKAKNFRVAAFMPFVQDAFDELDGRLDADAKIHIKEGLADGTMEGTVELRNGTMEVAALGQELHDVHASVDIKPWGTVRIQNVRARGLTGKLTAGGTAKLDGFTLVSAQGKVTIADRERLPVTVQGVPIGEASGDVSVKMERDVAHNTTSIDVDIPKLHLELPQSTGHSLQNLGDDPTIDVGLYRKDARFVLLPLHKPEPHRDPSQEVMHAKIHLGNDVRITRGTEVRVSLDGTPVFDVTDTTHAHGEIHLTNGLVELQGKKFHLDRGVVSFVGDPSNPQFVITAYWDAPEGTRVYADVTGTAKKPKVTLRSEPAHTQNEILSLVLFGTTESGGAAAPDKQSSAGGTAGGAAAGVATGALTQGVNKALSGHTDVRIEAEVDTSDAANPRPELELQVSQNVLLKVIENLGVPPPGQNPDKTLLVVDYRFTRRWSVETTLGDHGSSIVDLLWQYRY